MKHWIDISVPIRTGMVHWPGDPPASISAVSDIRRGDEANVSALSFGSHTGTHMDAPRHFLPGAEGIDAMPLAVAAGPARVIAVRDPDSIKPAELEQHAIRAGERILFRTRNSSSRWDKTAFRKHFVFMTKEAAGFLARRKILLVGVDYLSVGGFQAGDSASTHRALLEGGIWIVEGLMLQKVRPGRYEFICLPLRIANGDGAPARAMLRHA